MDLWFSRLDETLFVATAKHGQSPGRALEASSVAKVFRWAEAHGHDIEQVGIVPPAALGLTDEI